MGIYTNIATGMDILCLQSMFHFISTGACVHCIESVVTPIVQASPNHTLPEMTYWTPSMLATGNPTKKFLIHIRYM